MSERICCTCNRTLGPTENYYKIDGVRFWCIPCGRMYLNEPAEPYRERIKKALQASQARLL